MKSTLYSLIILISLSTIQCSDFNLTKKGKIQNIWEATYYDANGNVYSIDDSYTVDNVCANGDTLHSTIRIEKKHFYIIKKDEYAIIERTVSHTGVFYRDECMVTASKLDADYNKISKGEWEFVDSKGFITLKEGSWGYPGNNYLFEITELKGKKADLKGVETLYHNVVFTKATGEERNNVDQYY